MAEADDMRLLVEGLLLFNGEDLDAFALWTMIESRDVVCTGVLLLIAHTPDCRLLDEAAEDGRELLLLLLLLLGSE